MKRRATSFDVARRAGVSRSVVSAVLNGTPGIGVSEEKRKAVLKAIRELNYHIDAQARGMKMRRSGCFAVFGSTGNPLFLQVLEGIQSALRDSDYHVLLYDSGKGKERHKRRYGLIDLVLQRRVDGVVTLDDTNYADPQWAGAVKRNHVPYVSVEGYPEEPDLDAVLADYYGSIVQALDYLYERHGMSPVYLQCFTNDSPGIWSERCRRQAYEDWVAGHGRRPRIVQADMHAERPLEEIWHLVTKGGERMVLSNWSAGAVGLYRKAAEEGLVVGRDLLLMAADDTNRVNRLLVPSLSCMEIPYREMGEAAIRIMVKAVEQGKVPGTERVVLPARLLHGESG